MSEIRRATEDQAERMFEIMVRATEVGGAVSYPAEIIAIWHKGRSVEGMLGVIRDVDIFTLVDDGVARGFVHIGESEVVGLFVHPDDHRRGYGSELFRFAVDKIGTRPVHLLATLNAVPFYSKLGCRTVAIQAVRRHDHDIYVHRMELA